MSKQMNPEELAELRRSPHVTRISSGRVSFSENFKQMAYDQLLAGRSMRDIFEENGIDPDILG